MIPGDISTERVIDGMAPERVRVVEAPELPELPQCAPGSHCAAHGSGPFYCCRCGVSFAIDEVAPPKRRRGPFSRDETADIFKALNTQTRRG